jgi:gamma-glutamylcyclotransferase (GGCT)/AIG2-like uncharacterized protein YtfP
MFSRVSEHMIFVYGTLRRGGVREMERLFPGSVFLGVGRVRGRLYDLGEYPGLVLDERAGEVVGEVYRVSGETLVALDEIEDFRPDDSFKSLFVRKRVDVMGDEATRRCWIYVWNRQAGPGLALVESGDWMARSR